jgi:GrpB-like predicted nucleotidyltransferase (UPF0157 family)
VTVVEYDPSWPAQFETLRSRIWAAVGPVAIAVEHIGSTSVPGLAAKPIIDIDVVVASDSNVGPAVERLAMLGYAHQGDLGIKGREALRSPPGLPAHHLYVCVQGGPALTNHLTIRDRLRGDPDAAATYGMLKKRLAALSPLDRDKYIAGKTDFLLAVLRGAGVPQDVLAAIGAANRTHS